MTTSSPPYSNSSRSGSSEHHYSQSLRVPALLLVAIATLITGRRAFAGEPHNAVQSHSLRMVESGSPRLTVEPSRLALFLPGEAEDYFDILARQDQERQVRHGLQKASRRKVRDWADHLASSWLAKDSAPGRWVQHLGHPSEETSPVASGLMRLIATTDLDLSYGNGVALRLGRDLTRRGPDWFTGGRVELEPLRGSAGVTVGLGAGALHCGFDLSGNASVRWSLAF